MVRDLATRWIQSYPCKTKTYQETKGVYENSSSREKSRKSFTLTTHWNLANLVKILSWNHRTSTPHRSNSGTSSSSTSPLQDSSSTSSSPAPEGSDEPAPGNFCDAPKTHKKKDINRASDDWLRSLPEWLEEFTKKSRRYSSACTRTHVSCLRFGTSHESGIKRSTVLLLSSRKRNCEVCLRTMMTRALCRRRNGKAVLRGERFGDWMTADHKVLNEEGESRNNHRRSWYGIWPLDGFNLFHAKQKLLRRRIRV